MSATIELFEQFKVAIGAHADRVAALKLGIKSQTVSNWRTRGSQAEPWLIEAMCVELGHDPAPWLVRSLTEQATVPRNRLVWERVEQSLRQQAPFVALLASLPFSRLLRSLSSVWDYGESLAFAWPNLGSALSAMEALAAF